jgi:hypothetical protein
MSTCLARERAAVQTARRVLQDDVDVIGAETVRPAESPTGRYALLLLLERGAGGVPPAVQRELAKRGLTVRTSDRAGDCWRAVAVA